MAPTETGPTVSAPSPRGSPGGGGPRLLVAAGGTGGHVYPGLAVAEELRRRRPDAGITFAGTRRGQEEHLASRAGFPVEMIRVEPLRGGSTARRLAAAALLPRAMLDAHRLLARVRPDVVMGIGGYLSGPLLVAAWWRNVPTLLLEPNVIPGLANRWLAPFVDAAAVAWRDTADFYGSRAFVSGNPVRPEIVRVPPRDPGPEMSVLLFGGSQGSRALNRAMIDALPRLETAGDRLRVVHQTGEADLEEVREAYRDRPREARLEAAVEPYLHDMAGAYAACDLVVGRAGAATCAELTVVGRPGILVPLPAAGGHQAHNAATLVRAGAAVSLPQEKLDGERLAAEILALLDDPCRRARMIAAARRLARPDAASTIATRLLDLAG